MKLYLYCSYAHSRQGFTLSCLEDGLLVGTHLCGSEDAGEQAVNRFFSFDHFRILWQEFPENPKNPLVQRSSGGIFGVRGLRGRISGRDGVANFALLAEQDELPLLEAAAQRILGDLEAFSVQLFDAIVIGGDCGYQPNGDTLQKLIDGLHHAPGDGPRKRVRSARELLRFAVYIGSWKEASSQLTPLWLWKKCPRQAISEAEFASRNP